MSNTGSTVSDMAMDQEFFLSETGHTVMVVFSTYWRSSGGPGQFGFPLGEPFSERNADTGAVYTVQYFRRNPFGISSGEPSPMTYC